MPASANKALWANAQIANVYAGFLRGIVGSLENGKDCLPRNDAKKKVYCTL